MNLTKELQRIYDSEINFSISTFWDGGFDVKLGDTMNGFVAESTQDTIEEAIVWLIDGVLELFPESLYAYSRTQIMKKIRDGYVDTYKYSGKFLNDMISAYEASNPEIYQELAREYRIQTQTP